MKRLRWLVGFGLLGLVLSLVSVGCSGSECTTTADCTARRGTGSTCLNGNCILPENNTTDSGSNKEPEPGCSCQVNADCMFCSGRSRCENGRCVAAVVRRVKTWEKCNNDQGVGCPDKNSCIGFDSKATHGYCLPQCGQAGLTCPAKSKCVTLSSGKGVCLPIGTLQQGMACLFEQTGDKLNPLNLCQEGMDCYEGTCQKPYKVGSFEKCDPIRQCTAPQTCVILQSGSKHGYCINTCKEGDKTCDNGTGTCLNPRVDTFLCVPNPQGVAGSKCVEKLDLPKLDPKRLCVQGLRCVEGVCKKPPESDVDGECSQARVCKSGLQCVSAPAANKGICAPVVTSCDGCTQGRQCLPLQSGKFVCALHCQNTGRCPNNLRCVNLQAGTQSAQLCLP